MSDGKLYEAGITNVFNLPRTVKCTVYVTSQPIQGEPNADDEYPSPKGLQARLSPPTRWSNTIRPFPFSIFPVRHVDDSYTPDPLRRLQVCGEVNWSPTSLGASARVRYRRRHKTVDLFNSNLHFGSTRTHRVEGS
jgi:hypothetical protein